MTALVRIGAPALLLAVAALLAGERVGWADTPPGVWDVAKDPAERERWNLHVRVERLLHRRMGDDALPSEQRRDEELRLAAARAMLEDAGAPVSPDVRLRFDLGVVYERLATLLGRDDLYQRVVDVLVPALEMAPDHPAATFALEALVETYAKLDRPREEVAVSRRYIARLSDDRSRALTMMNMGEAEMRLGRLDDALGTFRSAMQICGTLPNSSSRNSTYALTLWDLAVALDRGGDARAAIDAAAKASQLTWDEIGPMGLPRNVTGWDAIRDQQNVFFVPDWEREWYLALGDAAAAGNEPDSRGAAARWASAETHWETYVSRAVASREDRWLAIGRLRRDRAHAERVRAEQRAARESLHAKKDAGGRVEERP
ncbi:MAG: tetratricopeptide repeat protein [Polyangiaceae bacterium]